MNYSLFAVISIILNVFIAVLFPDLIGLNDPLGFSDIRTQKFDQLDTNTKQYYIDQGIFNEDGTPTQQFNEVRSLHQLGETNPGVTLTDFGFSFLDWVQVGANFFKSIGIFFIAFLVILFSLPAPFNTLLGIPLSLLYIMTWVRLLMGR